MAFWVIILFNLVLSLKCLFEFLLYRSNNCDFIRFKAGWGYTLYFKVFNRVPIFLNLIPYWMGLKVEGVYYLGEERKETASTFSGLPLFRRLLLVSLKLIIPLIFLHFFTDNKPDYSRLSNLFHDVIFFDAPPTDILNLINKLGTNINVCGIIATNLVLLVAAPTFAVHFVEILSSDKTPANFITHLLTVGGFFYMLYAFIKYLGSLFFVLRMLWALENFLTTLLLILAGQFLSMFLLGLGLELYIRKHSK